MFLEFIVFSRLCWGLHPPRAVACEGIGGGVGEGGERIGGGSAGGSGFAAPGGTRGDGGEWVGVCVGRGRGRVGPGGARGGSAGGEELDQGGHVGWMFALPSGGVVDIYALVNQVPTSRRPTIPRPNEFPHLQPRIHPFPSNQGPPIPPPPLCQHLLPHNSQVLHIK